MTLDEFFASVATEIPGFAGALIAPEGDIIVNVAGPMAASDDLLRTRLAAILGADAFDRPLKIRHVQFDWLQLTSWHGRIAMDVLATPGVSSIDLDEGRNVIRIGVSSSPARQVISALVHQRDVPADAIAFHDEAEATFSSSLQDTHRPLVGGIRIARRLSDLLEGICTLGFNAVRAGVDGFITNSHCTAVQGRSNDGSNFHQHTSFQPGLIVGSETHDPPYTVTPCPSGKVCRYSDTAFVLLNAIGIELRGALARAVSGSISWNGLDRFRISTEEIPVLGRTVEAVGQTSGRRSGTITATCVGRNVVDTNIHFPCQTSASFLSADGDSGSPVYRITNSPAANDVALLGILWGGTDTASTFSGIDMISRSSEMGSVATCDVAFAC